MSSPLQTKIKENYIHRGKNLEAIRDSVREFAHINLNEELKEKD